MLTVILRRRILFAPKVPTLCSLLYFSLSSSASSAAQTLTPKSHLITDFLIKSCGFSPQKAATASKHIAGLKTFSNAESVRHFFKQHGFADADIRSIISGHPRILGADIEHALQPTLRSIRQVGFSESEVQKIIIRNSQAILKLSFVSRIEFLKAFLNNDIRSLALALTRNRGILNHDTDTSVAPKIAFLKGYGLSEADIRRILVLAIGFFIKSIDSMEAALKRIEEVGFERGTPMFVLGVASLHSVGEDLLKSKTETFMSYGWSEGEFLSALKRLPALIYCSEVNMTEKMEFLVGRAGCKKSYIVSRPALLSYSLEKRLMPRYHVLNIVRSSASMQREPDFYNIVACTEKIFLQRFVLRYMNQVPRLHDTYIAACSGEFVV